MTIEEYLNLKFEEIVQVSVFAVVVVVFGVIENIIVGWTLLPWSDCITALSFFHYVSTPKDASAQTAFYIKSLRDGFGIEKEEILKLAKEQREGLYIFAMCWFFKRSMLIEFRFP